MATPKHSILLIFSLLFALFSVEHRMIVTAQSAVPVPVPVPVPVRVGAVLDLGLMYGKRSQTSISMAIDDFYASHGNYSTRVVFDFRDSMSDAVLAASAVVDLLKNSQIQALIGPQTSTEAEFVAYLCNRSRIPAVSFSATSPAISPSHLPFFIRAAANDSSQSAPIAAFIQNFGWREVVPVYEDSDYGAGILPSLVDALESVDARIPYRVVVPTSASDDRIDALLYNLMSQQTRVFVVHMLPALATRLFLRAHSIGMISEGYVWIVTDSVGDVLDTLDPATLSAMEGVIGFRPYVQLTDKVKDFSSRFKARFRQDYPGTEVTDPTVYQFWAYDAVHMLAMAVESSNVTNPSFSMPETWTGSTDLGALRVSNNGFELLNVIFGTEFNGLTGKFKLVDGQLQLSAFEIVNVLGKPVRRIGFWTPESGIIRDFQSTKSSGNISDELRSIIWPGDPKMVPKGWVIPTNGKILRIGVPVKDGFAEFVNVSRPVTASSSVTGYCIDIFEAVIEKLPYAVQPQYVPFVTNSYDDLIYQVYLKNFDAVVGDMTIIYNRTNYVDFTLPYTESGVSMIVPIRPDMSNTMWIFLKPLSAKLWLTSLAFFIFTGFVVWMLEHRINPEFRGTKWQQFGLIYYFAFSTLVFAHKEKLESNLSRFAVIIWVFVVLILTSSYTASLTSMLTVQQLQPTVTDVNEILKNGDYVGYQDGSFVGEMLENVLGFKKDKLINYSTVDQYADALTKGSGNGGVAAIFDEIPYLKVFLSQYCSNYTMVGPTYKTDGFGFVFPKNSPLLPDVSRAILNVTQGPEMTRIEKSWFQDPSTCPSQISTLGSSSLSFPSFAGLFIITGSVSGVMLLCYLLRFIYKERNMLREAFVSHTTPWEIVRAWFRHYDGKDWSSPTFRNHREYGGSEREGNWNERVREEGMLDGSRSPVSISNHLVELNADLTREGTPVPTEPSSPTARRPAEEGALEMTEIRVVT